MGGGHNGRDGLLHCELINARSLCNKLSELHQRLYSSSNVDILIVTESWLTTNITDSLLGPNCQYKIYRSDRTNSTGGGVCIFVNQQLPSEPIDLKVKETPLAMLCLDLHGRSFNYRIFAVYRPTDSSPVYQKMDHVSCIQQIVEKMIILLTIKDRQ